MCKQFYWILDRWKGAAVVVVVLAIMRAFRAIGGRGDISRWVPGRERAERLDAMGAFARSVAVTEVERRHRPPSRRDAAGSVASSE